MSERPLLLGHRGARSFKLIPENTIPSFEVALAHGCDGFEFDVRLTADRRAVIHHEPKVRKVLIAKSKGDELSHLPRLQEVLERFREGAFLDIELKVAGLEKITAELIRKYPSRDGFVVSSFLPEVLEKMHVEDPSIPLGLICETKKELARWRDLAIVYVILHHRLASRSLIHEVKSAGRRTFVWTVNSQRDMRRQAAWGVDGIISDKTELLCETFARTTFSYSTEKD